jgi:outer membrane receptor protein involved in Fe transport
MAMRAPVQHRLALSWRLCSAAALLTSLLLALSAAAQEPAPAQAPATDEPEEATTAGSGVEEILVRGAESAAVEDFKVADSVTAFSAADLVALGAANIADLAAFTPNLEIVTTGSTTPTFFIRGVGLNDFNANSTGAVAIYQDDVAINAPALQLATLFDMENVNVLRGPQGTGLARNASAGAIKLYSRKPTGQFNGYIRGEGGNYEHEIYEGAVEAPIYEDILSGRLAFQFNQRDGTMKNRCGNKPIAGRAIVPPRGPLFNPPPGTLLGDRKLRTDPPWSMCGEPVFTVGGQDTPTTTVGGTDISNVPPGLPEWMNDRNNWASRGTLLFEPTLEMSWLLGAHGAHRNELSRVGRSYGTSGNFCLNGDMANCTEDTFDGGSFVTGLLGSEQGNTGLGYVPNQVRLRLSQLAPCYDMGFGVGDCTNPGSPRFDPSTYNAAKTKVARELARDLDDRPWSGDYNHAGKTVNDTWGAYTRGEILLPWELELKTVTGYDRYFRKIDYDLDFSPETLFHVKSEDNGWQITQDLALSGEHDVLDTPVRWDVGGFVLREALDVKVAVNFGGGAAAAFAVGEREYSQDTTSLGGYGSFAFDFWDDFTLDGGARFNWEKKDLDYLLFQNLGTGNILFPLNERDTWSDPTGTIRLTYRFREDTHAYWKYNRGWKSGHYNATGSRLSGITIAQPETIDAFETGLRAEWFNGMLSGDASLFYYGYQNYQIFTAQQFFQSSPEFVVINANDAEVYGAEIDALLRPPWQGGYLNVRFAWLESQFLDFVQVQQVNITRPGADIIVGREIQNSGNPLLNSPKYKVSITAEQAFPIWHYGFLIPRYDAVWTDDTFYDATGGRGIPNASGVQFYPKLAIAQRAFWLHNARLAYRTPDGRLELAAWVRNIENKGYKTFAFDGSTFFRTSIYFVGDPRTYGGTATFTF